LKLHRSTVSGRIDFWRENYRPAIFDFCNNIGTNRLFVAMRDDACNGRKSGRSADAAGTAAPDQPGALLTVGRSQNGVHQEPVRERLSPFPCLLDEG
jgi:hypothetical protein